ncbi:aldose 1-epimerase [Haloarcula nitratireducens]|uniref:Aldose 1-epimerase n=1 Tax=Haloarcula nitratireducens TaxID=2487749 RepID=A0AAW4PHQ5_9EURY|nr:aldose 1-epimerase [Halomicroarcula nitratireducens]MBX0297277.1 aldose 1-epimerase [Halomicroarcula nitratireducens]
MACTITDEYERRGIDAVFLENDRLRVELLPGKGGDVTEIIDKRTDTNVLFEAPHEWRAPATGTVGAPDGAYAFLDHYPGGWQSVLPGAGGPSSAHGAPLALHGESSLVPFETRILDAGPERVAVELAASLTRYPFDLEREISLAAGESAIEVTERVTNAGRVSVEYSWLQHVALGEPLVAPEASLSVPCETVHVDPDQTNDTARLPPGETFEWPVCETDDGPVDLREFPPAAERVHDLVALADLSEGRYTLSNPDVDLGVTVSFPESLYQYLWYWQPLGGFEDAPFFGRNYNVGLEPCTSVPNAGLDAAVENGTANELRPDETVESTVRLSTHPAE